MKYTAIDSFLSKWNENVTLNKTYILHTSKIIMWLSLPSSQTLVVRSVADGNFIIYEWHQ
ncbi:hypothetical protein HanRHA438_Chr10g0434101 [Helianthus annuus]|nr:hypothetical protein HanRHA438_Chr10g0434101 [Helianthus annuus]